MNKPKKCKNCEYYGKPYWSIINPCDNCPHEENDIVTITRWEDPTIEQQRKEIDRLNNIINELEKFMDEDYEYYEKYGYAEQGHAMGEIRRIKNKLEELKAINKQVEELGWNER